MKTKMSLVLGTLFTLSCGTAFSQTQPSDDEASRRGGPAAHSDFQGVDCSEIKSVTLTYTPRGTSAKPFDRELRDLASQMNANPACRVVVTGHGGGSKPEAERSWQRVTNIVEYMNDKFGIDRARFFISYGGSGKANTVDIRPAGEGEEGVSTLPEPHPGLRLD